MLNHRKDDGFGVLQGLSPEIGVLLRHNIVLASHRYEDVRVIVLQQRPLSGALAIAPHEFFNSLEKLISVLQYPLLGVRNLRLYILDAPSLSIEKCLQSTIFDQAQSAEEAGRDFIIGGR